jgi:hypothetical protein
MTLRYPDERRTSAAHSSGPTKWIIGFFLTLTLAALFAVLQLYLASSESTAKEAHRRAVNALAEGDAIIDRGYDDLRARAESANADQPLSLSDWPVQITLTPEEVLSSTPESLRALLLDRSADKLYADGAAEAFRDEDADGNPGRFSAAGVVEALLDLLRRDVHVAALIAIIVLGLTAAGLTLALGAATRGYGRLIAFGVCAAIAALPVLLGGLALNTYMGDSDNADFLRSELMDIGADLTMLPVRTGAALAVAAAALILVGAVCARITDSRTTAGSTVTPV